MVSPGWFRRLDPGFALFAHLHWCIRVEVLFLMPVVASE
jgi:hypothetical protein